MRCFGGLFGCGFFEVAHPGLTIFGTGTCESVRGGTVSRAHPTSPRVRAALSRSRVTRRTSLAQQRDVRGCAGGFLPACAETLALWRESKTLGSQPMLGPVTCRRCRARSTTITSSTEIDTGPRDSRAKRGAHSEAFRRVVHFPTALAQSREKRLARPLRCAQPREIHIQSIPDHAWLN